MRLNSTKNGNWLYLVLALLMALILWYMINAREQIERLVSVRLDYKGLPAGLTVLDGQINTIQVRLRGPRELFRTIESRDISYTVDLSELTPGMQVVPFDKDKHQAFRMYQVLEVIPPHLTLDVDVLSEKEVPVSLRTRQMERLSDITVRWRSVAPGTVRLSGPASVLSRIQTLAVEAVPDSLIEDVPQIMDVPVIAPQGVTVRPAHVTAEYELTIKRRSLALVRPLVLDGDPGPCTVSPTRIRLRVAVPERLAEDEDYLAKIVTSVSLGESESGEREAVLPIRVSLPEGTRLESITPAMASQQCN